MSVSFCFGENNRIIFWGNIMNKLYRNVWVPFMFNKKRILILAIASYIALC